ncbi:MAG: SRPBCC family protein [Planctomycetota bacterium]
MLFRAPDRMVFDAAESPARWPEWDRSVRRVEATFEMASQNDGESEDIVVHTSRGRWTGRIVTWQPGRCVEIDIVKGRCLGAARGRIRRTYTNEPLGCRLTFEILLPMPELWIAKVYAQWSLRRIEHRIGKCLSRLRHMIECVPPD